MMEKIFSIIDGITLNVLYDYKTLVFCIIINNIISEGLKK